MNRRERFEESGNIVRYPADRPRVVEELITGGKSVDSGDRLVVRVKHPIFAARVVNGRTIGGGTSKEALKRAKRRFTGIHHQPEVGAWMDNSSMADWQRRMNDNGSARHW